MTQSNPGSLARRLVARLHEFYAVVIKKRTCAAHFIDGWWSPIRRGLFHKRGYSSKTVLVGLHGLVIRDVMDYKVMDSMVPLRSEL